MYNDPNELLYGLALPLAVGLIGGLMIGRWRWGVAVALGGAYAAGEWLAFGWPGWCPVAPANWLGHAVAAATVVAVAGSMRRVPAGLRWSALVGLVLAALLVTIRQKLALETWMPVGAAWRGLGLAAAWLGAMALADRVAREVPGRTMAWLWVVIFALTATAGFVSSSQRLMQQGYVMTTALVGLALAASVRRQVKLDGGPTVVLMMLLGLVLLNLYLYASPALPWPVVVVVAVSPALGWLRLAGPLGRGGWVANGLVALTAFVVLGGVLAPLVVQFLRDSGWL